VVSVTTYRDAGFLPQAFVNFVVLLGWSPKDNREKMTREELTETFSLEGVNRSNAMINFAEEDPFDPKGVWLNAEHIRTLPLDELAKDLTPFAPVADFCKVRKIAPLIQERIKLLGDIREAADFFFAAELPPYPATELIPQKGTPELARTVLESAREILKTTEFEHDALEAALKSGAEKLKIKTGQMYLPVRVAVCGRKVAPPLFATLAVLGRETALHRIGKAIEIL
jgi:glutamyl-tRNA synthetase